MPQGHLLNPGSTRQRRADDGPNRKISRGHEVADEDDMRIVIVWDEEIDARSTALLFALVRYPRVAAEGGPAASTIHTLVMLT